jgi:hypothetical protein
MRDLMIKFKQEILIPLIDTDGPAMGDRMMLGMAERP